MSKVQKLITFIRDVFQTPSEFIPIHEPTFIGNEKKYILETLDSRSVSSNGEYVNRFEEELANKVGARYAIATNTGTAALHIALLVAGVDAGTEVITQSLSFIATTNAIHYCGATPIFLDVNKETLGLDVVAIKKFLETETYIVDNKCFNKKTRKQISAIVPMHTFGFSAQIDELVSLAQKFYIPIVEDAAEALGSYYKEQHLGTFGDIGIFSFNGNKTITGGGGGALVTNDENLAKKAKYLTSTAKVVHPWEYVHDLIGYNYRMPNINAALACAQLETLETFLINKRQLANEYEKFCQDYNITFLKEPKHCKSNYWMNAICLEDREERDLFLTELNQASIMSRPIWSLLHKMPMNSHCFKDNQEHAQWFEDRVINIPSSYR